MRRGGAHSSDNRQGYYRYVANVLSVHVNESADECTSKAAAVSTLADIRRLLTGDADTPGIVPTSDAEAPL